MSLSRSLGLVVVGLGMIGGCGGGDGTSADASAGSSSLGSSGNAGAGGAGASGGGAGSKAGAAGGAQAGFPGQSGASGDGGGTASGGVGGGTSAGGGAGAAAGASGGAAGSSAGAGGALAGSGGAGVAGAGGGAAGSGGAVMCPTGNGPSGPAAKKWDIATLDCGAGGTSCPSTDDKCFCGDHFSHLDVAPSHYLGVSTDVHKAAIWAAGNFQAVYVNDINTGWTQGATAQAAQMVTDAAVGFPCGVPAWFILNEISAGLWPSDATYRAYVVDLAKELKQTHGKSVIVAAPFAKPGAHGADWTALAQWAFVGAEVYLTGAEINAHGNSVAWCKTQYQASIDAYGALGVPLAKLVLFEHFGSSVAGIAWGRAGVSVAGWQNAIKARGQAAGSLGFAGFVSYGWSGNQMHETDANRLAFEDAYSALALP